MRSGRARPGESRAVIIFSTANEVAKINMAPFLLKSPKLSPRFVLDNSDKTS